MPPGNPNLHSSGEPIDRSAGIVAQVLDEGTKTIPISAEAASGQIEAALRLHRKRRLITAAWFWSALGGDGLRYGRSGP